MPSRLLEVIAALAQLRVEVEKILADGGWGMSSHADTEALAFMQLAIGDVGAIETLARRDIRLVIAGTAAARSAYEGVVTCAWMLAPNDLGERDRRWMALFVDERAYWKRMVEEATKRGDPPATVNGLQTEVQRVDALIAGVQPQFDAIRAGVPRKLPKFDELLEEVGQGHHYVSYKTACQLVHPTTRALALVRDLQASHADEPPLATYAYRTTARDWTVAISLGAESLAFGLDTIGRRLPPGRTLSGVVAELFDVVAEKLRELLAG